MDTKSILYFPLLFKLATVKVLNIRRPNSHYSSILGTWNKKKKKNLVYHLKPTSRIFHSNDPGVY